MQAEIVWGSADYSVQQAVEEMQQHNTNYIVVGRNGVVEGIVSKSDLSGAISPYLRPEFSKWRRPLDDATLQIKIRWIMSRQVHTVKPETPLTVIMKDMRRFGRRAMPVVDREGKVQGLVTVFDIFKALLRNSPRSADAIPQMQPAEQDSNPAAETIAERVSPGPV
jgi:CBS domain-containing membrane protein